MVARYINTIRVNFGFELLKRLSSWTDEELEAKEGELDFFLDQEMGNEFTEADELHGAAFYAQDRDYLVEAYDTNENEISIDTARLENVARNAIECIKMSEQRSQAAKLLGPLGGQSTSEAKVAAARRNGRKGGRPKRSPE